MLGTGCALPRFDRDDAFDDGLNRGFSASIHGTTSIAGAIRGPFACLSLEEEIQYTMSIDCVSDLLRLAIIKRAHNLANPEGFPHTIAGSLPWYQMPETPRHLIQACKS